MNTPVLAASHVQMLFFDSGEGPFEALGDATFSVSANEFVSIIGPSGCGKSTLLRILGGLLRPTAGAVTLDGEPLLGPQDRIGFVFQHANLMPWRTALANVVLPLRIQGVPRRDAEERAKEALHLVGLGHYADMLPRDLSGGMRQRVALARALVYDPDVLLLDEPFGALDALTRERMSWELLGLWQARQKSVVMVTHNIQEAILLSDRVLTMSHRPGRVERQVEIDIRRPRSNDDIYSPHFVELSHRLRDSLR